MNEVVANPFGARTAGTASSSTAVSQQSREVAEIQTKYLMAQRFPRDMIAVTDAILNAFTRPSLAEQAEYEYARGGQAVTGPTIRTAEAMAQQYQNIDFGFREVGRGLHDDGVPYSDVEAYAIDLQNRSRRAVTFVVRHWRDKKNGGGYVLKDERDINELVSNQAQRRVRSCILAIIPGDITEAAMKQVAVTLSANADTTPEGIAKMVKAFAKFDVTPAQIEKRIQRRLEAIQPAQVISLLKVFNSLRDGMSTVEDWFEPADAATGPPPATKTTSVKDIKDKAKPAAAAPSAAPTPIEGEEVAAPAAAAPPAAEGGGQPVATFAEVNDGLLKATTLDELDEAATLIPAVGNRGHQKELNTVYATRRDALGGH